METVCGKSCEACAWKEPLNCSGCREDMGRPFSGPCDIAACCREKGHQRCETCAYLSGCPRRTRRDDIPRQELQRREDEAARQRLLAETAPLMAKWVPLIFWLAVPLVLASLLASNIVAQAFPSLGAAGTGLQVLCGLAYGLFMWRLTPVLRVYRTAALCKLALSLMNLVLLAVPEESGLFFLLGIPTIFVSFYGSYVEFSAHAQAVEPLDAGLAASWRKLWKLLLLSLGVTVLTYFFFAFMGSFAFMLAALATLGLTGYYAVLRMICLWRTAKLFREWAPTALPDSSSGL